MVMRAAAKLGDRRGAPAAGLAVLLAALVALAHAPVASFQVVRERAFDTLLAAAAPRAVTPAVVVADIDRATLAAVGPLPWRRERLAALLERILEAAPASVAFDVLIEGTDGRSAAALARRLAEVTGRADLETLARSLPDGDAALARVLRRGRTALGAALAPDSTAPPSATPPVLVRGAPALSLIWHEEGAIGPIDALAEAAAGQGILSLAGDIDGRIRAVPLLVQTGATLRPGLAIEAVRLAREAGSYLLTGRPAMLHVADLAIPLDTTAMLRLRPGDPARHARRSISVQSILDGSARAEAMRGKIVVIGSSAPEAGGLRQSASGDLVPSVQIHADAIEQLLARDWPLRPGWLGWLELGAMIAAGALLAWSGQRLPALAGGLACLGLIAGWATLAAVFAVLANLLLDPLTVPAVGGAIYAASAVLAAAETRRREARIRRRFEQHLAPEVVRRMVEQPALLKLEGEMREITALFTDIEGFTAMTERAEPRALVGALDRYIEEASRIVIEHGGMVEKIVGDGLHAIFNAPLDLPDHPSRALAAALALSAFSERFRREAGPAALGFGRTRIGIETGHAIVGDVGGGRRLDYTAHGNAMNLAARLEAANKDLGTAICVGPGAASRIADGVLVPLGAITVRGRSERMAVFTPISLAPRGPSA